MAKTGRRKERRKSGSKAPFLIFVLLLPSTDAAIGEGFLFQDQEPSNYIVPQFPIPSGNQLSDPDRHALFQRDLEDFQARRGKRWSIRVEEWSPGFAKDLGTSNRGFPLVNRTVLSTPTSATVTVIHNLMEKAGLVYELPISATGKCNVEICAPRGPDLGPFMIRVNGQSAGEWDAWSFKEEPIRCIRLPSVVDLKPDRAEIRIIQRSPQDLPIYLQSLELVNCLNPPLDSTE